MELVSPKILQQLYGKWQELLNRNEGKALKREHLYRLRKQCVAISVRKRSRPILYPHGAGMMASVWDRR